MQGKTFSLLVSDTVLVSPKETTVLTEQAKSDLDSIRFQFAEQDEEAQQEASRRLAVSPCTWGLLRQGFCLLCMRLSLDVLYVTANLGRA